MKKKPSDKPDPFSESLKAKLDDVLKTECVSLLRVSHIINRQRAKIDGQVVDLFLKNPREIDVEAIASFKTLVAALMEADPEDSHHAALAKLTLRLVALGLVESIKRHYEREALESAQ